MTTEPLDFFDYTRPDREAPKLRVQLARTDLLSASVQVVREGGENNLHSHTGNDGFWFVLGGTARFYHDDAGLGRRLEVHQGVVVPRNTPYWFEQDGDDPLEMLHVSARDLAVDDRRVDLRVRTRSQSDVF